MSEDTPENLPHARGRAIQAYATVELSLSMMFSHLLGVAPDISGVIFYRIVNTRARNTILVDLHRKRYGDQYSAYWSSLIKMISVLDQTRNEIVHWHVVSHLEATEHGASLGKETLEPPNFWVRTSDTPEISVTSLREFVERCDIASRAMNILYAHLVTGLSEPIRQTWLEIFQKPLLYPLPPEHPLTPPRKDSSSPP